MELKKIEDYFINVDKNEPLKSEMQFFWQAVCGNVQNVVSNARAGLRVVEILESAESSMRLV